MSKNESSSAGGIGLSSLVGIVFIILKLCGVIAWPWIWVLAFFWIPLAMTLGIAALFGILIALSAISRKQIRKKKEKGNE